MNQTKIFALISSILLLLVLLMYKFEVNKTLQKLSGTELRELKPLASQSEQDKIEIIKRNFRDLKGIIDNFLDILKENSTAFQGLKPELNNIQKALRDLETMDVNSEDVSVYEDKYFEMFQKVVAKSNETEKEPSAITDDKKYDWLRAIIDEKEIEIAELLKSKPKEIVINNSLKNNNSKREIEKLDAIIKRQNKDIERLMVENKKLKDIINNRPKPEGKTANVSYVLSPFVEVYEGKLLKSKTNIIDYNRSAGLDDKRNKRRLTAYLAIPKIYTPSQLERDIFGESEKSIVDIKIYQANKLLSSKTLNLSKNEETHLNITDLIKKRKKSTAERTYEIKIYKDGKNYTENGGLTFIL